MLAKGRTWRARSTNVTSQGGRHLGQPQAGRRLPRKLVLLAGGSLGGELLVAMALSVSLRAFGDHLRLPVLIVVITLAGSPAASPPPPAGWAWSRPA